MKKLILVMVCVSLVGLWFAPNSMAATEAQKRAAIDAGLAYLATTQNAAGYFGGGGTDYLMAQTGSALLAFLEEKPNWGANAAAYQSVVDKGLNYLFSRAVVTSITTQTAGNPDVNGDGVGSYFFSGDHNRDTYLTGIILPAIASTGTPTAVVSAGPMSGWTYQKVVQNTIDYFAFGQSDPSTGNYRGGWRYYANYGNSDQSTTQWPVIAALFATQMGVSAPAFMKSELVFWTDYIQYLGGTPNTGMYGSAGYQAPGQTTYGNVNETGALLIEQAFLGLTPSNADVQAALGYINRNWQSVVSSWEGNFGNPYAMWAVYKGLELMIGLDADRSIISNLHSDPGDLDNPDHGWNWWEDYCEFLVRNQAANGSWAGSGNWPAGLATPWYINILAATEIPDNPVPEPATMLLLGSGLAGLGAISRRRRKK